MADSSIVQHFSNLGKLIALGAGIIGLIAIFVPGVAGVLPWLIVALAVAIILS